MGWPQPMARAAITYANNGCGPSPLGETVLICHLVLVLRLAALLPVKRHGLRRGGVSERRTRPTQPGTPGMWRAVAAAIVLLSARSESYRFDQLSDPALRPRNVPCGGAIPSSDVMAVFASAALPGASTLEGLPGSGCLNGIQWGQGKQLLLLLAACYWQPTVDRLLLAACY